MGRKTLQIVSECTNCVYSIFLKCIMSASLVKLDIPRGSTAQHNSNYELWSNCKQVLSKMHFHIGLNWPRLVLAKCQLLRAKILFIFMKYIRLLRVVKRKTKTSVAKTLLKLSSKHCFRFEPSYHLKRVILGSHTTLLECLCEIGSIFYCKIRFSI